MYSKLLLPVEIHTRVVVAVRAPIHSYLGGARAGMRGDTSDSGHMAAQQATSPVPPEPQLVLYSPATPVLQARVQLVVAHSLRKSFQDF